MSGFLLRVLFFIVFFSFSSVAFSEEIQETNPDTDELKELLQDRDKSLSLAEVRITELEAEVKLLKEQRRGKKAESPDSIKSRIGSLENQNKALTAAINELIIFSKSNSPNSDDEADALKAKDLEIAGLKKEIAELKLKGLSVDEEAQAQLEAAQKDVSVVLEKLKATREDYQNRLAELEKQKSEQSEVKEENEELLQNLKKSKEAHNSDKTLIAEQNRRLEMLRKRQAETSKNLREALNELDSADGEIGSLKKSTEQLKDSLARSQKLIDELKKKKVSVPVKEMTRTARSEKGKDDDLSGKLVTAETTNVLLKQQIRSAETSRAKLTADLARQKELQVDMMKQMAEKVDAFAKKEQEYNEQLKKSLKTNGELARTLEDVTRQSRVALKALCEIAPVHYAFSHGEFAEGDKQSVYRQIQKIFEVFPNASIVVTGHTDDLGNDEANMKLSESKAESFREYLVDQGVNPERVVARGKGETEPLVENTTSEQRAQNRRIEFQVVN